MLEDTVRINTRIVELIDEKAALVHEQEPLQRKVEKYSKTQEEYSRKFTEFAKLPKEERAEIILAKQTRID